MLIIPTATLIGHMSGPSPSAVPATYFLINTPLQQSPSSRFLNSRFTSHQIVSDCLQIIRLPIVSVHVTYAVDFEAKLSALTLPPPPAYPGQ